MPRRKGISPVIATVIIVAVTIAVAIAVAFWMTGIVGIFTGTERIEIVSIDVINHPQQQNAWQAIVRVRNTGTTRVTIDGVYINGRLVAQWQNNQWNLQQGQCQALTNLAVQDEQGIDIVPPSVNPGRQISVVLTLTRGGNCFDATLREGISIEIKLRSSGGKEYPRMVVLP